MNTTLETQHGTFYLRPYQDGDMQQVLALWECAFNQTMDERVWRWKFHNCPFARQTMLCCTDENVPIAMYAGIAFRANWEGRTILMTQLIDNMSHPGYRHLTSGRKGLFVQTAEHFFDTYGSNGSSPVFYYGFPGHRHHKLGEMLLHYGKLAGGGAYLEAPVSKISGPFLSRSSKNVEQLSTASGELDELWIRAARYFPLSVVRDAQFIRWRFFGRPSVEYHMYAHRTAHGLSAWAVVRFDAGAAAIVDMLALPDDSGLRDIVRTIARQCRQKSIRTLNAWLPPGHYMLNMLLRCGFSRKPEPLGIVPTGRSFIRELDVTCAAASIYYTMADTDLL